jgi:hypothetical protein
MDRYCIVSSAINTSGAGYPWEVLDTETHRTICAVHTREFAEFIIPLLHDGVVDLLPE